MQHWYAPHEITFKHEHNIFLMENLSALKEGHWPREPVNSYTDPGINIRSRNRAPFEIPCQFAAEIENRLEQCGIDGIITKLSICYDESSETIAAHLNLTTGEIQKRINRCLNYISGYCAKWISCENCNREDKCQHHHASITYSDWCAREKYSKILDKIMSNLS